MNGVKTQDKPAGRFENGSPASSRTLLSLVGESATFEGKFEVADSIDIECEVRGELVVGGKIVIGQKGVVRANVQTLDAVIHGVYEGNIVATGDVEIAATGRVNGNIETDSLVIAKGGVFNGTVSRPKRDGTTPLPAVRPLHVVDDGRLGRS